jgi:Holliday junction resolvase-like predicted endonuclease
MSSHECIHPSPRHWNVVMAANMCANISGRHGSAFCSVRFNPEEELGFGLRIDAEALPKVLGHERMPAERGYDRTRMHVSTRWLKSAGSSVMSRNYEHNRFGDIDMIMLENFRRSWVDARLVRSSKIEWGTGGACREVSLGQRQCRPTWRWRNWRSWQRILILIDVGGMVDQRRRH